MTETEWRKFYEDQLSAWRYNPKDAPTFEEFKTQQINFLRQCANQQPSATPSEPARTEIVTVSPERSEPAEEPAV